MGKLKLHTPDFTDANIHKLAELFPNCVTESRDDKGNLKRAIDFDQLRQELSKHIAEGPQERYQLNWPGKREALITANAPIAKTLRPCREESVDFDTTQNLYIEWDNFEVLKVLQESYLGKIKMIYIDPPYNTGKDFVYRDDFKVSKEDYEEEVGVKDEEWGKLFKNTDTNGRFHSDWLSMMYERLLVARDLLKDDWVIFMSIDDNEIANLRKVCDEIFGEENFINQIVIKSSETSWVKMSHTEKKLPKIKEYLLVYSKKDSYKFNPIKIDKTWNKQEFIKYMKYYSKIITNIEDPVNKRNIISINKFLENEWLELNEEELFKFKIDNATKIVYRTNNTSLEDLKFETTTEEVISSTWIRYVWWEGKQMLFLSDYTAEWLCDLWTDLSTINLNKEILDIPGYDNWQKPLELLIRLLKLVATNNDIILDFFSWSSTTAHSVIHLNVEDWWNRKFIMVQIPEIIEILPWMTPDTKKSTTKLLDLLKDLNKPNLLTEVWKERIRRAWKKILEENTDKEWIKNLDIGFRVYRTDDTNMKDIYYHPSQIGQDKLDLFIDNIKEDRTPEDLLTQVILNLGLTLDLPIESKKIKGNTVFFVAHNSLVACFDAKIDFSIVDEIAKLQPLKVVFRDSCFADDKDRINVENRLKRLSPETVVSVI